jgi:hypothetical protein
VLAEAFKEGRLTGSPDIDELLQSDSDAVQAYKMLQAMVKLARTQVIMEGQLSEQRAQLSEHEKRLEQIESSLGTPDRYITPAQASRISQAIKAIAMELSKISGRNEYGGVYGEMYRRFEINSYRELPASRYDTAMKWLNDWYQSMTKRDIPF